VTKEQTIIALIKDTIKETEFEGRVHLVGGYVRDELLGRPSKDIDLVIDMDNGGIQFTEWFTKNQGIYKEGSNPVIFPRFGVARFVLEGIEIECVMPRSEVNYEANNRKSIVVRKASLKEDAMRRDFNINTLYKDISTGEIIDFTGAGIRDLKARVIDTPVEPNLTFGDPKYGDALRMLRAIRFAAQLGFTLTERVLEGIEFNRSKLHNISKERIHDELIKILMSDNYVAGIEMLKDTKLLYEFLPEFEAMVGLEQGIYHSKDGFGHTMDVLHELESEQVLELKLAALLHDIGKPRTRVPHERKGYEFLGHDKTSAEMTEVILRRLKFSNEIVDKVTLLVRHHMGLRSARKDKPVSDRSLRKFARKMGDDETLFMALELVRADMIAHPGQEDQGHVIDLIKCRYDTLDTASNLYTRQPIINGNEIKEIFDLKEGPGVGMYLKVAQEIYDRNPEVTKEEMIEGLRNPLPITNQE
jgi:poly(A) polymerase